MLPLAFSLMPAAYYFDADDATARQQQRNARRCYAEDAAPISGLLPLSMPCC